MSAFDSMTWRIEADARLRSTLVLTEVLDCVPDADLVAAHDWATRVVPRLRQRVVEPALPVGPAVWSTDPNFDLRCHFHRVQLPRPGSLAADDLMGGNRISGARFAAPVGETDPARGSPPCASWCSAPATSRPSMCWALFPRCCPGCPPACSPDF
jgi:hypothetical protein